MFFECGQDGGQLQMPRQQSGTAVEEVIVALPFALGGGREAQRVEDIHLVIRTGSSLPAEGQMRRGMFQCRRIVAPQAKTQAVRGVTPASRPT